MTLMIVGFVGWLLLTHLAADGQKKNERALIPVETLESEPREPTFEEQMLLQEKQELERKSRIERNMDAVELALEEKRWEAAQRGVNLLQDDSYPNEEAAKLAEAIERGKLKEIADLSQVQKLLEKAAMLDSGRYSPEAISILDKALLIAPQHKSTRALKRKINSYPYSLRVPEDVATLNEAVDALRTGDTAILGKGVFRFATMLDKGINIKGQGEALTFIECDTTVTSAFTLVAKDQTFTISDLTIRGTGYEDDATDRYSLIMSDANLTMKNVTVQNGSGHGVAVVSGELNIDKCKIRGNAWDGVSIMGDNSYARITDCDISGNHDHGVDFWKGASGKLRNVTANANMGTGVLIMGEGAKVHLIQVKTEGNSQCGIVINSKAHAILERVFTSNNILSGVAIQGMGSKLTCRLIVSNKNGEAGFFIDPEAEVANFKSTTAEANTRGDVVRKAMAQPSIPVLVKDPDKAESSIVLDAEAQGEVYLFK